MRIVTAGGPAGMSGIRRRLRPLPALVALIAVLLPGGVFAAATVDGGRGGGDQQVRTAGFDQEGIVAGPAPSRSPEPTMVTTTTPPPPPPPPTTTTRITPSTVTTVSRATTATTVRGPEMPIPDWSVPPGGPPPFPVATIPGGSSWSNRTDGVSVRMRMVPAAPVAGQPVTFFIDYVIAQDPCCAVALTFGDSPTYTNVSGGTCDSPTSLKDLSITHTYAAPGAYEARLATVTFPCGPVTGDPPHRAIHGAGIHACIVVGPGRAGAGGCPAGG